MSTSCKGLLACLLFVFCAAVPSSAEAHARYAGPTREIVLIACHPCTDCKFEIPVCVPLCCDCPPKVCFEKTILGAGRTVYEWPCGFRVIVRYTHNGGYRVAQR